MNKFTLLGLIFLVLGGCILGFQAISSMMAVGEITWKTMNLVDVTSPETLKWVNGISIQLVQKGLKYIVTMPLYMLSFALGVLLLIIGGFISK
ncbi:MAG: hypothetical protein GY697_04940 [Desulfobacterales bacterium]|nr:hypothetical protein [Desulfobacterales bacterium]